MHIIVLWSHLAPVPFLSHPPPPGVIADPKQSPTAFVPCVCQYRFNICQEASGICLPFPHYPLPFPLFLHLTLLPPQNTNQDFHGFVHLFSKPHSMKMRSHILTALLGLWATQPCETDSAINIDTRGTRGQGGLLVLVHEIVQHVT